MYPSCFSIICNNSGAVYVGYNASQNYSEDAGGHDIQIDLNIVETAPELLQIIEKQDGYKSII